MKAINADLRIEGEQIYLRPITIEDTDMVLKWRNAPHVVQNFIYRKPITREEHLNWLKNKVETGKVVQFIICDKQTNQPIGSIYIQNIEEEHRKAEEGIFLGETQGFGRGIGSEAAKLMVQFSFEQLGLHKLTARVLSFNTASIRMHEKAGYVQESYLHDELYLDGKFQDLVFLGILNTNDRE